VLAPPLPTSAAHHQAACRAGAKQHTNAVFGNMQPLLALQVQLFLQLQLLK
jgi:hypothetical protein